MGDVAGSHLKLRWLPATFTYAQHKVKTVSETDVSSAPLALEARGVRRAFGAVQAVADASLAVAPGTVTALIGPNGCGKTTLMLMLAGLLKPDAGTVAVGGLDPSVNPKSARVAVGWMPDALGTWDSLTCLETLVTFGRAYGLTAAAADAKARELLERVHLEDLALHPARVLSRGQKQRLSLARALVHNPSVLILDEPASGLDPRSRIELRDLVRELAAEGKAVLISSHVLSELDEMVDGSVFMSKGRTLGEAADSLVAQAKSRWTVVAVTGDLASALATLGRDFTPDSTRGDNAATVHIADDADAGALVTALAAAGVAVARISPTGSALEQAYLDIETERR